MDDPINTAPQTLTLFHTGFSEILSPDVHFGRKNADFGQGFYLSPNEAFSRRWARFRKGSQTILNRYFLQPDGLKIRRFTRDEAWFDYIFSNRTGNPDTLQDFDVIIGPIANDTLYDTWGVLTSGLISVELALRLLSVGPAYEQVVLKTEKAASALQFISSQVLPAAEITAARESVREEEAVFQEAFAALLAESDAEID